MSSRGLTPEKVEQLRRLIRHLQTVTKRQPISAKSHTLSKSKLFRGVWGWLLGVTSGVVGNGLFDLIPEKVRNTIKQTIYRSPPPFKNLGDLPYVVSISKLYDVFAALDLVVDSRTAVGIFESGRQKSSFSVEIVCDRATAIMVKSAFVRAEMRRAPEPEDSSSYDIMYVLTRAQSEKWKASLGSRHP
jgi:hypothetical protein